MTNYRLLKKQYLAGIAPIKLSKEHGISNKTIHNLASEGGWVAEKNRRQQEAADNFDTEIQQLTKISLKNLRRIINRDMVKDCDKVSAIRCALDISGLKSDKKEVKLDIDGLDVTINQNPVKKTKN